MVQIRLVRTEVASGDIVPPEGCSTIVAEAVTVSVEPTPCVVVYEPVQVMGLEPSASNVVPLQVSVDLLSVTVTFSRSSSPQLVTVTKVSIDPSQAVGEVQSFTT
jgi:hypothetical protein